MSGTVNEVIKPEKLVYTSNAIMNGKPILETLTTLRLENFEGKTKMTLHIVVTKTTSQAKGPLAGMEMGWNQSLDKLTNLLKI